MVFSNNSIIGCNDRRDVMSSLAVDAAVAVLVAVLDSLEE
jgi:hypothetical protein